MKKYVKLILISIISLVVVGVGVTYAFFNYNKTGSNNKVIAGSLYLTLNEGNDTINLSNMLPETKEEARVRTDNTLTFTLKGKNTSTTKDINYEILLSNGADSNDNTKERIVTKDLMFDLVEIGANNSETYILDAVSYEELTNQKIWVDTVSKNTTSEIEKTYRLRMWVSDDVIVSDSDPNADYTTDDYKNRYASVKIAVEGDMEEKSLPLVVMSGDTLVLNNRTYINNTIENADSTNNEDTFNLTITSSNSNVTFDYDNNPVIADIISEMVDGKVDLLLNDDKSYKVQKLDNEEEEEGQGLNTFSQDFTLLNNKKVTFKVFLISLNGKSDTTDLHFVLRKNDTVVQEIVKHVNVRGSDKPGPNIEFVNRSASYSGEEITLSSVTITNSDNSAYNGDVSYTYYKGSNCSGQQIAGVPTNVGIYSVRINATGTNDDGNSTACGTITITKKNVTPSITSCNSRDYNGQTSAICDLTPTGKVEGDVLNIVGTCNAESATAGNDKSVTCSNLSLSGDDKGNYLLTTLTTTATEAIDIKKVTLTIKANDATFDYGETTPAFTYTAMGFVNNETVSVLTGSITYTIKDASETVVNEIENPGSYTIIPSGFTSSNYDIKYSNGTYHVNIVPTAVTASIGTCTNKTYNGTTKVTCEIQLSGVDNGDEVLVGGSCNTETNSAGDNKKVVCTGLALSGSDASKYVLSSTTVEKNSAVNIAKKTVNPAITSCTNKSYDNTTTATCTYAAVPGKVGSDAVSFTGGTCNFNNASVGTGKTVSCVGMSLTGANSGNYELSSNSASKTANIIPRVLIPSTPSCSNKVYDGTNDATCAISYSNVVAGETVNGSATCTFDNKNAGNGKTVTCTSFTKAGADSGNYEIPDDDVTTTANITPLELGGGSYMYTIPCSDKVYDGTTIATCTITYQDELINQDEVIGGATCTFADKNVDDNKTVTCTSFTKSGDDSGNYSLPVGLQGYGSATITAREVTPSATVSNKVYDGTITATCASPATLVGVVSGDDVVADVNTVGSFDNANVGTGKTVTCNGISLSGTDADNYSLSATSVTTTANITAREVIVTADNKSINYGGSAPTYTYTLTGEIPGDTAVTGNATYAIKDNNVVIDDVSTVNAGSYTIVPSGLVAGSNYAITYADGTLTINKLIPSITLSANSGSVLVGNTITFNAQASVDGSFTIDTSNSTYATATLNSLGMVVGNTNNLATVTGNSSDETDPATATIYIYFTPTDSTNYATISSSVNSASAGVYTVTVNPHTRTATFNPNGNGILALDTPDDCSKEPTYGTVTCSCTTSGSSTSCEVPTPEIVNPHFNTPNVCGYTESSTGATSCTVLHNSTASIGTDKTYYAQTYTAPVTYTVTYDNAGATSGGASNTTCTIATTYNGQEQSATCAHTLASEPTKTGKTFYGWKSSVDGSYHDAGDTFNIGSSLTFTATWDVWAADVSFDDTNTDLNCDDVQCALDEISERTTPICKRATTLNTEECVNTSTTAYCQADGYALNGDIEYGNLGERGAEPAVGDAFDCNVDGTGYNQRFYYVSDYYNTSSKSFDTSTAVLVYYSNTKGGVASYDGAEYATLADITAAGYTVSAADNWHGPVTAIKDLPTTTQWSNVTLKTTSRIVLACDSADCIAKSTSTSGGTITPSPFSYAGRAARLLTLPELKRAGCDTLSGQTTLGPDGSLTKCNFLLERTKYADSTKATYGLRLENPVTGGDVTSWWLTGVGRKVGGTNTSYPVTDTRFGVRPVIDVPYNRLLY